MARYNFMEFITTIQPGKKPGDIQFYDILSPMWLDFEFKNGYTEYELNSQDVDKFYLVAQRFYGSIDLADILFLINGLQNPFALRVGHKIKIPRVDDITLFRSRLQNPTSNL